jgi:ABC-type phosphate transport system substrate-binding protein
MGRLIKLTKRLVASGAMLAGGSVLAQGLFSHSAQAAAGDPECSSLTGVVYVSGSSAVQPVLAALSKTLVPDGTTIVYFKQGSCTGVAAILGTNQTAGTGTYFDATGAAKTCNLSASQAVDVGVSDVFATSCPGVTPTQLTAASIKDYDTFFAQVMEFVVPGGDAGSDQTSISAEAAYLTFGLGNASATPWDNQELFAIRNASSGTQTMLGKAIGLDASKWLGHDETGSGPVFNDIKGRLNPVTKAAADPKKLIGILSSGEADADPVNVKKLAFQATGQTCAFWADSGVSSKDKKYVRDGHYPVWGPLHVLVKTTAGVPNSSAAKKLIDTLSAQDEATVLAEITANVVPMCAMNVTRDSEIGPLSSIQPTQACGCYFDSLRAASLPAECKACTAANAATVCTGARTKCNYGFCEVK